MKLRSCLLAAACAAFAAHGEVAIDDGVMSITSAGNLSALLSADDKAALTGNSVTNVFVDVGKSATLSLDVDLSAYVGGWSVKSGTVSVELNAGAFGSGTSEDAAIFLAANNAQLFVPVDKKVVVSNPVTIEKCDSGGWKPLYVNDVDKKGTTTLTLNGKVTVGSNCNFHFQGLADMYFRGGIEQTIGTIGTTGANGHWVIENVPCSLNAVKPSWVYLDLKVAGNSIKTIYFNGGGSKVVLYADDALVSGVTKITSMSTGYFDLRGHDCTLGELEKVTVEGDDNGFKSTGGAATLTFTNSTDQTLVAQVSDALSLKKCGAGKLTIVGAKKSSGGLEIVDGEVAFDEAASWTSCSSVTLSGGSLSLTKNGQLGTGNVSFSVKDAAAEGVVSLADGVAQSVSSFTLGATVQDAGIYGGAASAATYKLDVFTPTGSGVLSAEKVLTVDVPSGSTLTIADALSADNLALLKANGFTQVTKTGAGTLTLDEPLANYTGSWLVSGGMLNVTAAEYGLGNSGTAGLDGVTVLAKNKARLYLDARGKDKMVVKKPITFDGHYSYMFEIRGVVEIEGLVSAPGKNGLYYVLYGGDGRLYFNGGVDAPYGISDNAANGHVHFRPPLRASLLSCSWITLFLDFEGDASADVGELRLGGGAYCTLTRSDLFAAPPDLNLAGNLDSNKKPSGGKFDLNGFDFSAKNLWTDNTSIVRNTSDAPATLTFADTVASTNLMFQMEGKTSLVKNGTAEFALGSGLIADGSLTVAGGKFTFLETGAWQTCTNVAVSGAGVVVTLNSSTNLGGRVCSCAVADGGKFSLAEGVEQEIGDLYHDGRPVTRSGTYGSSESPAQYKRDWLAGKGVFVVHSSHVGTAVIIR